MHDIKLLMAFKWLLSNGFYSKQHPSPHLHCHTFNAIPIRMVHVYTQYVNQHQDYGKIGIIFLSVEKKTYTAKMINDQEGRERGKVEKNYPGSCKMTMGTNVISA